MKSERGRRKIRDRKIETENIIASYESNKTCKQCYQLVVWPIWVQTNTFVILRSLFLVQNISTAKVRAEYIKIITDIQ